MTRMTLWSASSPEHGLAGKRLRVDDKEREHSGTQILNFKMKDVPRWRCPFKKQSCTVCLQRSATESVNARSTNWCKISAARLDLLRLPDSMMTNESSAEISLVSELPGALYILEDTGR